MSPSSGPMRLGQLLSESWAFCKTYWKPILIAAVILGALSAIVNTAIGLKATQETGMMMNSLGMDTDRMQELGNRLQAGDESAAAEMEDLLNENFGGMTEEGVAKMVGFNVFKTVAPFVGVSMLIGLIITVLGMAYYLLLALQPSQNAQAVAAKTPKLFFPLLLLWIWIAIRSFIWIPFIGIITAIILGPRFALAQVILVQEKKGVMQSASESYRRTQGYWGKIFGNVFVAALCIFVVAIAIGIVAGIATAIAPFLGVLINEIGKFATSAFMAVFTTRLALTIMANPMKVVPVKK